MCVSHINLTTTDSQPSAPGMVALNHPNSVSKGISMPWMIALASGFDGRLVSLLSAFNDVGCEGGEKSAGIMFDKVSRNVAGRPMKRIEKLSTTYRHICSELVHYCLPSSRIGGDMSCKTGTSGKYSRIGTLFIVFISKIFPSLNEDGDGDDDGDCC